MHVPSQPNWCVSNWYACYTRTISLSQNTRSFPTPERNRDLPTRSYFMAGKELLNWIFGQRIKISADLSCPYLWTAVVNSFHFRGSLNERRDMLSLGSAAADAVTFTCS